jgi:hypothetical protein
MRVCRKCNIEKTLSEYKSLKHNCIICKECQFKNKKRIGKSFSKINNQLQKRYNITLEDYNKILENQGSKCAICKTNQLDLSTKLHVDHCHTTGIVRGLLCYNCNSGLGRFKDNINFLNTAINYLKCADTATYIPEVSPIVTQ